MIRRSYKLFNDKQIILQFLINYAYEINSYNFLDYTSYYYN